jgi:hypothetical protein
MNRNALQGMKATKFAVHRCTPQTTINEMGSPTRRQMIRQRSRSGKLATKPTRLLSSSTAPRF